MIPKRVYIKSIHTKTHEHIGLVGYGVCDEEEDEEDGVITIFQFESIFFVWYVACWNGFSINIDFALNAINSKT